MRIPHRTRAGRGDRRRCHRRVAAADHDHGRDPGGYSIGLWGDLPHNDVQKTVGVPGT